MKKIVMVVVVSVILSLGANAGALDVQQGISQYKWGDSASKYQKLSALNNNGEVTYYSRSGEKYVIGNVTIGKIIYGFYNDQLFAVYLTIDSLEVYDKLLSHMESLYGLPVSRITADNLFVSKWKQNDVRIKLKLNEPLLKMKLAFYYHPLSSKLNDNQLEEPDTSSFRFVPIEKDKKPEKFVLFEF